MGSSRRRLHLALGITVLGLLAAPVRGAEPAAPLDLSAVEGADKFPGGDREKEMLARQGFVVLPRFDRQIFSVYIGNTLPHYVTADSAHWTYHVLFETALKEVERTNAARLRRFVVALHSRLAATSPAPELAAGHGLALAYAAVAARLFGEKAPVPADLVPAVAAEVDLAMAAAGVAISPLFAVPEDYASYAPRGACEGESAAEEYFRAATWLSRRGFRVADERETMAAIALVRAIEEDPALRDALRGTEEMLDWLVGPPDDLTEAEYAMAIGAAPGGDLAAIRQALSGLRGPEVNGDLLDPDDWVTFREKTKGLRLLPARRTPDAWLLQQVAEADPAHPVVTGLLVGLALGSARAGEHLAAMGEAGAKAAEVVRARSGEFRRRLEGTHYGDALKAAALLLDPAAPVAGGGEAGPGAEGTPALPAPAFRTGAWNDRLLAAGLASWASLRHAFALHAKTMVMYMGQVRNPAGVVEPVPAYYAALGALARTFVTRAGAAGLLVRDAGAEIDAILHILEKLARRDPGLSEADMTRLEESRLEVLLGPDRPADPEAALKALPPRLREIRAGARPLDEREAAWLAALVESPVRLKLAAFADLADRLRDIAARELRGEVLTEEDDDFVRHYGETIAALNFYEGNSWLAPESQMGLVAEFARDPRNGESLEAAVGAAMELYVVLPLRGGGSRLYRGGAYAFYEFTAPRPIPDSSWLADVEARRTPPLPAWTGSYVPGTDVEALLARIAAGEEAPEADSVNDPRVGDALLERLEKAPLGGGTSEAATAWAMEAVGRYLGGERRDRGIAALLRFVLHAPDKWQGTCGLDHEAVRRLAGLARPADRARLLALLKDPPPDAVEEARARLVEILSEMEEPPDLAEVEPLLTDEDPLARGRGLDLLAAPRRPEGKQGDAARADRTLRLLSTEPDAAVRGTALGHLAEMAEFVPAAAGAGMAKHLQDGDAGVRAAAAEVLGAIGAADCAEGLFPLLYDGDSRVTVAAARALGRALGKTGGDPALRSRAVTELVDQFASEGWHLSVACLDGLCAMGGEEAAAALAGIAGAAWTDTRLRGIAIDRLADAGEAAVPYLYRLSFDEAEIGYLVNGVRGRVCDAAVESLNRVLGCPYGRRYHLFTEDGLTQEQIRGCRDRIVERARAEARERDLAPPGK